MKTGQCHCGRGQGSRTLWCLPHRIKRCAEHQTVRQLGPRGASKCQKTEVDVLIWDLPYRCHILIQLPTEITGPLRLAA